MEMRPPRVTIQAAGTEHWVVRLEHRYNDNEYLDVQLVVKRSDLPVKDLDLQVMRQLQERLRTMPLGNKAAD